MKPQNNKLSDEQRKLLYENVKIHQDVVKDWLFETLLSSFNTQIDNIGGIDMLYNKFVIDGQGRLIMGRVEFHFELLGGFGKPCYGGGLYEVDEEEKVVYLSGSSCDFGSPRFEHLKELPEEYYPYYAFKYNGEEVFPVEDKKPQAEYHIYHNLRNYEPFPLRESRAERRRRERMLAKSKKKHGKR